MVFLCMQKPLEEMLEIEKEKRLDNLDWLLFDDAIKDKSLKPRNDLMGKGNSGNLETYMSRVYYYPLYYTKPLYCYLMTDKHFKTLDFLPDKYKNTACIWNMKKVPMFDSSEEEYPRVEDHRRIISYKGFVELKKYLHRMFLKLVDNDFKENPINYIILGSEKSLKELSDSVYDAINIDINHHNEKTYLLIERAYDEYISKGGEKDLSYFKDTLDSYLINGYCGY